MTVSVRCLRNIITVPHVAPKSVSFRYLRVCSLKTNCLCHGKHDTKSRVMNIDDNVKISFCNTL
jgi:hypothetical protein